MYSTLKAEIARKEMKFAEIARACDMLESTFSNKINGRSPWNLPECVKVKDVLGVDMPIDELFKED